MADHPDASLEEHLWSIAVARIVLGADVARAGAAEPRLRRLSPAARRGDRRLGRRLAGHPRPRQPRGAVARPSSGFARPAARGGSSWRRACRSTRSTSPTSSAGPTRPSRRAIRRAADAHGLAREDRWAPGEPRRRAVRRRARRRCRSSSSGTSWARRSSCGSSTRAARERERVLAAADRLRRDVCGDEVTYVVTRNIQYTNVCYFRCGFCAFSKGKLAANLRGPAYLVPHEEIARRVARGVGARRDRGLPPGRDPSRRSPGDYYASVVRDDQGRACPRCTSTRSRRSRSGRARRRSGSTSRVPRTTPRPRSRLAAGHGRRDPRRRGARGHLPRQGDDRRSGSRCTPRRTGSGSART